MDLDNFLRTLIAGDLASVVIVAAVVGGVIFGIVEALGQKLPNGLTPDSKFWLSLILAILIPFGAYLIESVRSHTPITGNGLFLAGAVAYAVAQTIHWAVSGSKNAAIEDKLVTRAKAEGTMPKA